MSYNTYAKIAEDSSLRKRIVACAAQEGLSNPSDWAARSAWHLPQSDWVSAWEYAVASELDDPGSRDEVITDQMILSAVQARIQFLQQEPPDA